jgi:hypothetical protein
MWAGIAVIFVIALVVVSFAAGGAWLIIAVPLAAVVLAPVVVLRVLPRRGGVKGLREEAQHARPAIQHASEAESTVKPPSVP